MDINIRKTIFRRFGEFAFLEVVLSVMITVFSVAGILESQNSVLHSTVACVAIYLIVSIYRLRICFYELENPRAYYICNLTAYGIFTVINVISYLLLNNNLYTWFFAVTKFARYAHIGFTTATSIEAFHIIMLVSILLAPMGIEEHN